VRLSAVESVRQLAGYKSGLARHLQPLLQDPDSTVRARAAAALLCLGPHPAARDLLRSMAVLGEVDERVQALYALAEWGDQEAFALIAGELADVGAPSGVRRAAATALAACGPDAAGSLTEALADEDRGVREAAAAGLICIGPSAVRPVVDALFRPGSEDGALVALAGLPRPEAVEPLRRYARERLAAALQDHDAWRKVAAAAGDDARARLLTDALGDRARRRGLNVLRALGLLGDADTYAAAVDNLQSRDPAQRANALEALESVREAALVRPLLRVWEATDAATPDGPLEPALRDLLVDPDPWLRACAAFAAHRSHGTDLRAALTRLAESDPDPLARATAVATVYSGETMDTLPTLSVMERLLFLRRVPLFADLTPADLKQVAAIAGEQALPDGEVIAAQGEPGEEMFVIVSGEVRVLAAGQAGAETEVARRGSGDVVGEMAVISQEPRMASLVAAGDVRVLCLDRRSFEGLLRERPEVSLGVMRVLCQRLKEATR
jgi:hypothetical protein